MVCHFTFSAKEYLKAVALHSWFNLPKTLLVLALITAFFGYVAYFGLQDEISQGHVPANEPEHTQFILSYYCNFLPVILIPAFLVLTPFWGYINYLRTFRKSPFLGKNLTYNFNEKGLKLESGAFQQVHDWNFIGKTREGRQGFLLFFGKSRQFHWIPISCFANPQEIGRFRELIAKYVKDSR